MSYLSKRPPKIDNERLISANRYTINIGSGGSSEHWDYGISLQAKDTFLKDQFTSSTTAGFKQLKKRDLPVRYFHSWRSVLKDSEGSISRVPWDSYGSHWTEYGLGKQVMSTSLTALTMNPYGPDQPQVAIESQQRCLKSMSNMKFNSAQAFAERKQTANLLVKSVNRFISFAILAREGKFSQANKILGKRFQLLGEKSPRFKKDTFRKPTRDDFANLWLEYSYGWRPLAGDIHGAAELLAQTYSVEFPRPSRSVGTSRAESAWTTRHDDSGLTGRGRLKASVTAKTVIYYDVESQVADVLKSTGISNPALLAWELLPYSFVLDWFIPVGSYLEACNASAGLRFIKGSTSTLGKGSGLASSVSDNSQYILHSGFPAWLEWAELTRERLTAFPSAQLPSLSLGLNLSQVTSGLALLNQLFRK